jgi:hypothetical protein
MKTNILKIALGAFGLSTILGLIAVFTTNTPEALVTSIKLYTAATMIGTFGVMAGLVGAVYPKDK